MAQKGGYNLCFPHQMPLASTCLSFRVSVRVSEQHILTSQCNVTLAKGSPMAEFALSLGHLRERVGRHRQ